MSELYLLLKKVDDIRCDIQALIRDGTYEPNELPANEPNDRVEQIKRLYNKEYPCMERETSGIINENSEDHDTESMFSFTVTADTIPKVIKDGKGGAFGLEDKDFFAREYAEHRAVEDLRDGLLLQEQSLVKLKKVVDMVTKKYPLVGADTVENWVRQYLMGRRLAKEQAGDPIPASERELVPPTIPIKPRLVANHPLNQGPILDFDETSNQPPIPVEDANSEASSDKSSGKRKRSSKSKKKVNFAGIPAKSFKNDD